MTARITKAQAAITNDVTKARQMRWRSLPQQSPQPPKQNKMMEDVKTWTAGNNESLRKARKYPMRNVTRQKKDQRTESVTAAAEKSQQETAEAKQSEHAAAASFGTIPSVIKALAQNRRGRQATPLMPPIFALLMLVVMMMRRPTGT